jgi:hypothetical protein
LESLFDLGRRAFKAEIRASFAASKAASKVAHIGVEEGRELRRRSPGKI